MSVFFIGVATILVLIIYYVLVRPHDYWKNRGVECEKPQFILGNWGPVLSQKCCTGALFKQFYDKYPEKQCVPLFQLLKPVVLIKDPEIIKQVTIKDFDSFTNRTSFVSESVDSLAAKAMYFLPDERWRHIRSVLSPAFTVSKLKVLFQLIVESAKEFTNHYDHQDGITTIEAKSVFSKVANDIIVSTAFGVKVNSMKNSENDIYVKGQKLVPTGFIFNMKILLFFIFPYFAKLFSVKIFDEKISNFFRKLIIETIQYREKTGVVRPDMLHLMLEARKGKLTDSGGHTNFSQNENCFISDDLLAAQCLVFYMSGLEPTSTTLSFLSSELALNPDIQQRLYNEISEAFKKDNGKITYETLLKMKYLDMVLSESLRKWPSGSWIERKAGKPVNITMENGENLCIDENVSCYVGIYALHRDPSFWPNPNKFDPERFNEDNKYKIHPSTYIPFGSGPRSCIASRFGILSVKTVIVHMLHKFQIVPVAETDVPLKIGIRYPNVLSAEAYWLGLSPRETKSV